MIFLQFGLCNAMKVALSILKRLWGGRLVDLLLREQPFTVMVHEGCEAEKGRYIVGILLKTPGHATINLNRLWERAQKAQQGLSRQGYLFLPGIM